MNEASLESTVVENYTDEFYADDIDELVIDGLEASRSPPRQLSQLSRHQQGGAQEGRPGRLIKFQAGAINKIQFHSLSSTIK